MVQMKGIVLSLLSITVKVTHQLRFIQVFLLFSFFLKPKKNKMAIDSNLAESFFSFPGSKVRLSWRGEVGPRNWDFNGFYFFFFLSFFLRWKRGSGVRYHEASISTQVPDSYSDAVPRQWMREERLVIAFCPFWLICNDSFLFHSAHRRWSGGA